MIVLFQLTVSFSTAVLYAAAASRTIVIPDDYPTLTTALSQASEGDTILIKNGKYSEQNLVINKSLTIKSEYINGAELSLHPPQVSTPIPGGGTGMVYDHPIRIYADDVEFSGLIITSDGGDVLANGNRIQIANITMATSFYMTGNGSQATDNTLTAIHVTGSNNTIRDNHVGRITTTGTLNFIGNNDAGSMALIGSRNIVDGNSFVEQGSIGMWIIDAYHNTITNNVEKGGNVGIAIGYANPGGSYNIFAGNTVEQSGHYGILVQNGSGNVFYGNRIARNSGVGLGLGGGHLKPENNLFFHNIFIDNAQNFEARGDINSPNFFDSGAEGNYWDDYMKKYPNATESGYSGIGNTPYLLYANVADNYPLMNRLDPSAAFPALPAPWSQLLVGNTPSFLPTQEASSSSPKISILSPRNTSYAAVGVPYAAVALTLETNASLSWVGYSLDGGANITASNGTVVEVPVGSQYLTVYANDTAGNWATPQTVYYTVAWNGGIPPQPFPWLPVAAISVTVVAVVAVAAVVYLNKRKGVLIHRTIRVIATHRD